jgi:large repetitive protein
MRRRRPLFEALEDQLLLSTFLVTNTNDSGEGSLRAAIEAANSDPPANGEDIIEPSTANLGTIDLQSGLPPLKRNFVTIEEMDIAGGAAGDSDGLDFDADHIDGFGNTITGFAGNGLDISGNDNLVEGNQITRNAGNGIQVTGGGNQIGGFTPSGPTSVPIGSNLVSGNSQSGIDLDGPGASGNVIENNAVGIDRQGGSAEGNGFWGIFVQNAPSNIIGGIDQFDDGISGNLGNVISGNEQGGLAILGTGSINELVEGNEIGTDITGTVAIGNAFSGIYFGDFGVTGDAASDATIGGTAAGARNLISNNGNFGVWIDGAGATGALVEGNFIGTDASGTVAMGNAEDGVDIDSGASGNTIGGTVAGAANIISGNLEDGINLNGVGTSHNLIAGNLIGTKVTGTSALPNALWGAFLGDAGADNSVGGTTPEAANIISGNDQGGVAIFGINAVGDVVEGNRIGTDITGTEPLGNAFSGVYVGNLGNTDDAASDTTIGGTAAGAGNLISDNGNFGVWITGGATGTLVAGNLIGTNVNATAPLGNAGEGVLIDSGASGNTIGGTTQQATNVIAGNGTAATSEEGIIPNVGIVDSSTTDNLIEGNDIGTNAANAAGLNPPFSLGLGIANASGNTVGGTVVGARNIISANTLFGVLIEGGTDNLIEGDFIGVDSSGEHALSNGQIGVFVNSGASDNTIGGTSAAARNIISGNGFGGGANFPGVEFTGTGTSGNLLEGNFIGTDATGTFAIGNFSSGVAVEDGADNNTIGGSASGAGNLISGNGSPDAIEPGFGFGSGVDIAAFGTAVTGTLIEGNLIGTDVAGINPLGNLLNGVNIQDNSTDNTVGGSTIGAGNVIAYNGANGVMVGSNTMDQSVGNAVLENSIFANDNLGISLGGESSPTGTPIGSPPSGPNNLQNAPILTSVISGASNTTISGTLSAAPDTAFRIEFFSNPAGTSQGETFIGFLDVMTDGNGAASFTFSPTSLVEVGLNVTATVTDPDGNTSEFSAALTVQQAPMNVTDDLAVTMGGFIYNRTTRQFTQTVTFRNISDTAITGPIESVLVNLRNATLVNQSGETQGHPFITVLSSGSLGIGQSLTVTLIFADPTLSAISYTPEFLAGPIPSDN